MTWKYAAAALAALPFLCLLPGRADAAGYCREYTSVIQVGGRSETGYGTACLQPDGAWKVVMNAGGGLLPSPNYVFYTRDLDAPVYFQGGPVVVHHAPVIVQQRPAVTWRIISYDNGRYHNRGRHYDRHDGRHYHGRDRPGPRPHNHRRDPRRDRR